MRIAVAGGTGTVGRYVVEAGRQAGHDLRTLSRRSGVDVCTGDGLWKALQGVDVVIDTTNAGTTQRAKATMFFTEVARQLQTAAEAQGAWLRCPSWVWNGFGVSGTTKRSWPMRRRSLPGRCRSALCGRPSSTSFPRRSFPVAAWARWRSYRS